jgi:hypothetical protein
MILAEAGVPGSKRCSRCEVIYQPTHWAYKRIRCPACGALLEEVPAPGDPAPRYEHYDSSVDVRFDLSDILSPDQHREARTVLYIGLGLILAAFLGRILFVVLGGLEGFWSVPVWFDVIVAVMICLGALAVVWSFRKLAAHRRKMREGN